jgi:hypothetical protein
VPRKTRTPEQEVVTSQRLIYKINLFNQSRAPSPGNHDDVAMDCKTVEDGHMDACFQSAVRKGKERQMNSLCQKLGLKPADTCILHPACLHDTCTT